YYILLILFFTASPHPVIYPLSLHDALPISESFFKDRAEVRQRLDVLRAILSQQTKFVVPSGSSLLNILGIDDLRAAGGPPAPPLDRKSTRLNSSHVSISYAVFCLKKKIKDT